MSNKAWIVIGLICIAFGAIIALLVGRIIDERPEKALVKSYLLSNPTITNRFGMPITVTYKYEGSSVAFHRDRTEGKCRFEITGSKDSGTVRVQWRSNDSGENFSVERIELLHGSTKPEIVWQKGQ